MAVTTPAKYEALARQLLSLMNGGGWKSVSSGSMASTSSALVITDGVFDVSMVGWAVAVERAGDGGTIGSGRITAFTDANHVAVSFTNASGANIAGCVVTYGPLLDDDRRSLFEVHEGLIEADAEICTLICMSKRNGYRNGYAAWSADLTHGLNAVNSLGAKIPEHIGPIGKAEVKVASTDTAYIPAEKAPLSHIRDILRDKARANHVFGGVAGFVHDAALSPLAGLFNIEEGEVEDFVHFTGYAIRLWLASFTPNRGTVAPFLQSPDAYAPALLCFAFRRLLKVMGDVSALNNSYGRIAEFYTQLIMQGEERLPRLEELQERQSVPSAR